MTTKGRYSDELITILTQDFKKIIQKYNVLNGRLNPMNLHKYESQSYMKTLI